jgi:hypothetical protein
MHSYDNHSAFSPLHHIGKTDEDEIEIDCTRVEVDLSTGQLINLLSICISTHHNTKHALKQQITSSLKPSFTTLALDNTWETKMSRPILPTTSISSVPSLQSQSSHSPTKSFRVLSTSSSKGKEKALEIPENGLLIPTDRDRDELEGKWLHHLGRFRIHSELKLQGYSLYSLRTWYVLLHELNGWDGADGEVFIENTLGTDYSYSHWTSGSGMLFIWNGYWRLMLDIGLFTRTRPRAI